MKKFFMAGGTGCIGRADTEYMLNHGYPVTVFGSLVVGHVKAVASRPEFIPRNLAKKGFGRQPQCENAEAIIPSVWKRMAKLPDGYRVC